MQYLFAVGLTITAASTLVAFMFVSLIREGSPTLSHVVGVVGGSMMLCLFAVGWSAVLLERSPEAAEIFSEWVLDGEEW